MTARRDETDLFAQLNWTRRLAAELVADAGLAEDLVQDAWLQFLKRPPRPIGSQRAWLATVMRNLVRQRWRREQWRDDDTSAETVGENAEPTQALVARAEAQRALVDAVLELEQPTRDVLLLHFWEELDSPAIAERLGMPPSSVRTRLQRGLTRLRERLEARHGREARDWLAAILPLLFEPSSQPPSRPIEAGTAAAPTTANGSLGGWALVLTLGATVVAALVYFAGPPGLTGDTRPARSEGLASSELETPAMLGGIEPTAPRTRTVAPVRSEAATTPDRSRDEAPGTAVEPETATLVEVRVDGGPASRGVVHLSSSSRWMDGGVAGGVLRVPVDLDGLTRFEDVDFSDGAVGLEPYPGAAVVQRSFKRADPSEPLVLRVGSARIEGRVWTEDGAPAAGVEVQLGMRVGHDYGALRGRRTTGSDGRFDFDALLASGFWLYADVAAGGGEVRAHGALERGEVRTVDLGAPAGRVRWSGRLLDTAGSPVVGLDPHDEQRLEFLHLDDERSRTRFPAPLTPEGRYSVALVPGEYDVYRRLESGGSTQLVESRFTVAADAERDLVLPGARVKGVATKATTGERFDPDVHGRTVLQLARETEGGRTRYRTAVSPEGRFAFEGVAPGSWLLENDRLVEQAVVVVIGSEDRERSVDVVIR